MESRHRSRLGAGRLQDEVELVKILTEGVAWACRCSKEVVVGGDDEEKEKHDGPASCDSSRPDVPPKSLPD